MLYDGGGLGFIPFFRLDNDKRQSSSLRAVKPLIDDYDMMASSLSNNLIDFDHPLYIVRGFQGDDMEQLQQNLRTKKTIGTDGDGGVEIKTIDVPYQAREAKLSLDEKNIYRFGMGLNLSGLKDTAATTNMAIKAAYSLLDLRCHRLETSVKRFLRPIVDAVVDEVNEECGTDYQKQDVRFEFRPEIMSNEQENAQAELTEAQTQGQRVGTLLGLSSVLDDDTIIRELCGVLGLDYTEVADKLPEDEEKGNAAAAEALGATE